MYFNQTLNPQVEVIRLLVISCIGQGITSKKNTNSFIYLGNMNVAGKQSCSSFKFLGAIDLSLQVIFPQFRRG